MEKNRGGRPSENQSHDGTGLFSLSEMSISRNRSSRWHEIGKGVNYLYTSAIGRHRCRVARLNPRRS